jgi:2-oxoglutarate dehydrogenase E2 component (dihydrolipoamide succinyltransferase)
MIVEVKVNELPESVPDGTLLAWHKQPGDQLKAGDALAEIETDKVVLEVSASTDGVLGSVRRKQGETVRRGDVIATIEASDANPQTARARKAVGQAPEPAPHASEVVDTALPSTKHPLPPPNPPKAAPPPPTENDDEGDGPAGLAPSVRRLLAEHKLSAADISGTGPRGRITKEDVVRHLEHSPHLAQRIGEAPAVVEVSNKAPSTEGDPGGRPTTRVRMSRLRARIAERMLEAQRSAAILTTFNEINMQALTDLRHSHRDAFASQHGVKLGIMGFFVRACTEALRRYPIINAALDGEDVLFHGYFDVSVAVSTTRGLVVPVLRDADRMSLADIERNIADFVARGEEGKLGIDELTGGTFTISNGGVFGSMLSTPILNPPQSAILGLHRIEQRPIAEGDRVVIRPMMYVALSYDHRIIDGREAVLFLVAIKELIEDPTRFILGV